MTCQEALKKLYEIIDKEASQSEVQEVKKHLEDCSDCLSRYEFEEMFQTFIVKKASSYSKTEKLRERVLSRIEDAGDAPKGLFGSQFRFAAVLASAAVALVICVVAAFAVAEFYRHRIYIYPFEKQHAMSQAAVIDKQVSIAEMAAARNFLTNDMHLSVGAGLPEYALLNTCFCEICGNRYVHLIYLMGHTRVSLFVGNADGVRLPDCEKAVFSGSDYFRHIGGECQLIYWKTRHAIIVAVSENNGLDLTPFIPVVQPI